MSQDYTSNPVIFGLTKGSWFMIIAATLFATGSMVIKLAGQSLAPTEVVFSRAVIGIPLCVWLLRREGRPLLGRRRALLSLRGILGGFAFLLLVVTFIRLPIGDGTVIFYIHPVLILFTSAVFLGERAGWQGLVCGVACVIGVTLVAKPTLLFGEGTVRLDSLGVLAAVGAAMCASFAVVTIRGLTRTEPPAGIMLYPLLFLLVFAPLAGMGEWRWPQGGEWFWLAATGIVLNMAQFVMTKGYALETAFKASAMSYSEVLVATSLGIAVFGDDWDLLSLAGAALIIGSALSLNPLVGGWLRAVSGRRGAEASGR